MRNAAKTVAFPSISTGAYGYPVDKAAPAAVAAVKQFVNDNPEISGVTFVCFDRRTCAVYQRVMEGD